jgi:hypothetical protein
VRREYRQLVRISGPRAVFRKLGVSLFLCLFWPALGSGQDAAPVNLTFGSDAGPTPSDVQSALTGAKNGGVYALRVRSVKVEGRWANRVPLPLAVGDTLTNKKLSGAMQALRDAIMSRSNASLGLRLQGEIGVLYIDVTYDTTPADGTVGVTFRPYYIHISLVQMGNNILPIPRSRWPTFYQNVPKPLLALNPTVGLSYDRIFGSAISASLGGDVLLLFVECFDSNKELDLRV